MQYVNLFLAALLQSWNGATNLGIQVRSHRRGASHPAASRWTAAWLVAGSLVGAVYIRLVDYQCDVTG